MAEQNLDNSASNRDAGTAEQTPISNPLTYPSRIVESEGLRPSVFIATVIMVLAADQFSKAWIVKSMALFSTRPVVGDMFRLTLTHNTGGAWGLLPRGNAVFSIFAGFAIMALIVAYNKVGRIDIRVGSAFALAMGGAIGNLVDRIRLEMLLVDFFDAHVIHWPIFNLADSAITISILILIWHFIKAPAAVRKPAEPLSVVDTAAAENRL